jgi:hypothetical protein
MKKIVGFLFQIVFTFPFILFLLLAGLENYQQLNKLLFLVCIAILLILGIGQQQFYKVNFEADRLIVIPSVLIGTIITYSLQYYIGLNAILSAAIIGITASFLESKSKYILATPIYCGAFVGMTNPNLQLPFIVIISIGFVAGCIYFLGKNFYGGIGGKLGTIAFTSVIASLLIVKYLMNHVSI